MRIKSRFINTKEEWMNAFGFMDGKPETWARGKELKALELVYETDPVVLEEIVPPPIKFTGWNKGLVIISFTQYAGAELLAVPPTRNLRPAIECVLLVGPCECTGAIGYYSPAI